MTARAPVMVFVVRSEGCWWFTPVPVADPTEVNVDDVRAAIAAADPVDVPIRSGPAARGRELVELATDDVVAPVRSLVGVVTAAGVVIEDVDGAHLILGDTDLTVLDALVGPVRVDALAERCGLDVEVVTAHLADLLAAGRLRRVDARDDTADSGPSHSDSVGESDAAPVVAEPVVVGGVAEPVGLLGRLRDMARQSSKVAALRRRLGLAPLEFAVTAPETTPSESAASANSWR